MNLTSTTKLFVVTSVLAIGVSACGGGSGSSDPDPQPMEVSADFGKTISDLVMPEQSTTLPDGNTFDSDGSPIELADYVWDIDDSDVDESVLDELFSE